MRQKRTLHVQRCGSMSQTDELRWRKLWYWRSLDALCRLSLLLRWIPTIRETPLGKERFRQHMMTHSQTMSNHQPCEAIVTLVYLQSCDVCCFLNLLHWVSCVSFSLPACCIKGRGLPASLFQALVGGPGFPPTDTTRTHLCVVCVLTLPLAV